MASLQHMEREVYGTARVDIWQEMTLVPPKRRLLQGAVTLQSKGQWMNRGHECQHEGHILYIHNLTKTDSESVPNWGHPTYNASRTINKGVMCMCASSLSRLF